MSMLFYIHCVAAAVPVCPEIQQQMNFKGCSPDAPGEEVREDTRDAGCHTRSSEAKHLLGVPVAVFI